ncbi:hypothetical protein GRX01_07185 [Halobaculum sp. WSA2]|uniref:Response regulatory domain-containing protein n=1 Tax=Halobaculum saliterrae TaxID=2073113 RepID=A0A6B0T3M9_9EURY|nr:hypothetical protein [Halobaculum saliterrae]MXR41119.1 hypothetical protein [Halobaculum saliterrae]
MSTHDSYRTGGDRDRDDDPGDLRVVHVEPDDDFAGLADAYLRRSYSGIDVVNADGADDAASAVRSGADAVVTDHRPPLTDAAEVATAVHQVETDVPVVVLSGAVDDLDSGPDVAGAVAKRDGLDALDSVVDLLSRAVEAADGA